MADMVQGCRARGDPERAQERCPLALGRLRSRPQFLAVARGGRRRVARGFVLLAFRRAGGDARVLAEPDSMRVGFTCSRRLGGAVVRNRVKRRLRALARALLPKWGQGGWDYVLIGREGASESMPFEALLTDLRAALRSLHGPGGKEPPSPRGKRRPSPPPPRRAL